MGLYLQEAQGMESYLLAKKGEYQAQKFSSRQVLFL